MMCSSSGPKLASLHFATAANIIKKMLRCMKLIASVIQPRCDEAERDARPLYQAAARPLQSDRINTRRESAVKPDGEPDKNVAGGKGETGDSDTSLGRTRPAQHEITATLAPI